MNDLQRELAPVSTAAWRAIEAELSRTLRLCLAARKLVEFSGPRGWHLSAVDEGRVETLDPPPAKGVGACLRRVQPLVELRVPFEISRREIDAVTRGAEAPDLGPVVASARAYAQAEDGAVFNGYEPAGIRGIGSGSPHEAVSLSGDYTQYPGAVTEGCERLREAGVAGPYALALGPRCFTGLKRTAGEGGYPVLEHVTRLVDGPVVWAPVLDGALVLSLRGGDFRLTAGRDVSVGYRGHDDEAVRLDLVGSFTFQLLGPEAAVPLVYGER